MTYIARTLIYDWRQTRQDPETGELVEHGYVQPGEPIDLNDEQASILLELGYVARPEDVPVAPVEEPAAAPAAEEPAAEA